MESIYVSGPQKKGFLKIPRVTFSKLIAPFIVYFTLPSQKARLLPYGILNVLQQHSSFFILRVSLLIMNFTSN